MGHVMCDMAWEVVQWSELLSVAISAQYILGRKNILVDQLSLLDQVLLKEWSFFLGCLTRSARSSVTLM